MRRRVPVIVLLALLLLPGAVSAQVRHCLAADGTSMYTDRRCDAVGGRDAPPPRGDATQLRGYRPACSRTLRDLAWEVSAAVEARDVNRLAGAYLWTGMGTREGYALMSRLQAVVDRPLVDLQPVWPGAQDPYGLPPDPPRPPVGLRLEQTSLRGGTPIRTVFGLRRYLDCWWIVGGATRARPAATKRAAGVEDVEVVNPVPTPAD